MLQKLPWKDKRFTVLLGLLAAVCLQYILALPADSLVYTNSWLAVAAWAGGAILLIQITHGALWAKARRYLGACAVFGTLFALALVWGAQLESGGAVDLRSIPRWLAVPVLGLAFTPCLAWLMARLEAGEVRRTAAPVGRQYFLTRWALLFAAYIPTLLASWPGFFTYDANSAQEMVMTGEYTLQHPLLHTLLLGGAVERLGKGVFGSVNAGIVCYLLCQMALLAAIFAYILYRLRRLGVRAWVCNLGAAWLALFPTVTIFAVCTTKDVLFSAGVTLLAALLLVCAKDPQAFWSGRGNRMLFAAASVLIVLFRNNGIYAYAVFLVFFVLCYRHWWRRWLAALLVVLAAYAGVNDVLAKALDCIPCDKKLMLSVPMQQLARTYVLEGDTLTEQDLQELSVYIPLDDLTGYLPKLADPIAWSFVEWAVESEPVMLCRLWVRVGLRHIETYINAFLIHTYQSWYPDTFPDGYGAGSLYHGSSYFEFRTQSPGKRDSKLPVLEEFYRKIGLEIYFQKVPVLSMLFSIGFWLWAYLFAFAYLCARGKRRHAAALLPLLITWLTVLLGPIMLVRYVLYFFFGVPLLLAVLLDGDALLARKEQ